MKSTCSLHVFCDLLHTQENVIYLFYTIKISHFCQVNHLALTRVKWQGRSRRVHCATASKRADSTVGAVFCEWFWKLRSDASFVFVNFTVLVCFRPFTSLIFGLDIEIFTKFHLCASLNWKTMQDIVKLVLCKWHTCTCNYINKLLMLFHMMCVNSNYYL